MLRRKVFLLALAAATTLMAACASPTAPKQECINQQGSGVCK